MVIKGDSKNFAFELDGSAVDWDGGIKVWLLELRGEALKRVSVVFWDEICPVPIGDVHRMLCIKAVAFSTPRLEARLMHLSRPHSWCAVQRSGDRWITLGWIEEGIRWTLGEPPDGGIKGLLLWSPPCCSYRNTWCCTAKHVGREASDVIWRESRVSWIKEGELLVYTKTHICT